MRIRSLALLGSAAILVASAAPAHAADPSASTVATIFPLMVTKTDATKVGVTGSRMSSFTITTSDQGTPDAPWLCDLSGDLEVQGKGAPTLVATDIMSLKSSDASRLSQELNMYASVAQAKAAFRGMVKLIKQCEGQHTSNSDTEDSNPGGLTEVLTNGTKKTADGQTFLWVRSVTTIPGVGGYADHSYITVRVFGKVLQVFEVESQGIGAPPLTAKQIAVVDGLTSSLGDRLASALR